MDALPPLAFFAGMTWIDSKPLLGTIEPYRRRIFTEALTTLGDDGWPKYNRVLCGRAKKNFKTTDLILAALYRFLAYPSAAGNDCFIIANDEEQAGDDLSLAKKLIEINPALAAEVQVYKKEIARRDGRGSMKILPAKDVLGLHGKTYLFLGYDEIHGYRDYGLFEALSPDPTRLDVLTWITSYAGLRHAAGIPLYDLLKLGMAGDDPRMYFSWYSADFTTDAALTADDIPPEVRANPSMEAWGNPRYLADQKRRLPNHRYRRLHLNLPGAPDGAALNADAISDAIVPRRRNIPPQPGIQYYAFTDMSGGTTDDATLAIVHEADGRIVLDVVTSQNGQPPFNPRHAIAKFVNILHEYGLHRVTGDKFAGETFLRDFRDQGIKYDVSDMARSQLYELFEMKLNAGLIELLDVPKLQEQLLNLVAKSTGKIDHQTGDHDDWANAVAGAVTLIAVEQQPALIHAGRLYAGDAEAVALPRGCQLLYAVLMVSRDGMFGVGYFAACTIGDPSIPPLFLCDYETGAMTNETIPGIAIRLHDLTTHIHVPRGMVSIYVPPDLKQQIHLHGLYCEAIPKRMLQNPAGVALAVAGHVNAGQVRVAEPAALRSVRSPLRGILAYRPDERIETDPLRWALIAGIAVGLVDEASLTSPVDSYGYAYNWAS